MNYRITCSLLFYTGLILGAALREVKEETGMDVKLTSTTGVYNFISPTNDQVILFHFMGEIIGGSLQLEEECITDYKWIEPNHLLEMDLSGLRNGRILKQITENIIKEQFYPLSIVYEKI
ncbi:NUDIX hydrolase [Paenibacillus sp. An7]|uniref:NUDIX hydrolase n=1 Tax=Paenibacillus sp. An7 TaxID=2689577 RepID=UPI001F1D4086|nr:NUDIX domain-containing protein [Paenibacillus sp. An7]